MKPRARARAEPPFGAPMRSRSGRPAAVQIGVICVASSARSTCSLPRTHAELRAFGSRHSYAPVWLIIRCQVLVGRQSDPLPCSTSTGACRLCARYKWRFRRSQMAQNSQLCCSVFAAQIATAENRRGGFAFGREPGRTAMPDCHAGLPCPTAMPGCCGACRLLTPNVLKSAQCGPGPR